LRFGLHLGLAYMTPPELKTVAQHAECLGFDWISIFDHIYSSNGSSDRHSHDAVAMHSFLAAVTNTIQIGCLVYVAAYRPPGVLAKAMATVDHISGGRVTVGLGAGWNRREFSAFGIPFLPPADRISQLEEYFRIVQALLNGPPSVTFSGRHFTMLDAVCEPRPVQQRVPLWIGGAGERRLLPLAARLADGWNAPYLPPGAFALKRGLLAEACHAAGRDVSILTCSANVGVAWSEADLHRQYGRRADELRDAVLMGSTSQMHDLIGRYRDAGADQLNISIRATRDRRSNGSAYDLDRLSCLAGICRP
jgi:probable F420-dependent oxidoreductase